MILKNFKFWSFGRLCTVLAGVVLIWASFCLAPISIEIRESNKPAQAEALKPELTDKPEHRGVIAEFNDINTVIPARREFSEQEVVEAACDLIEQGRFEAAGKLIESFKPADEANESDGNPISQLKEIVGQWRVLQDKREAQKEAAYKEQFAVFERVKKGLPADVNVDSSSSPQDVNDANGPKGPTAILEAAIRTIEFTNERQKEAILSDPCVRESIEAVKIKSQELEQRGKWFDAYMRYYSLLTAIDPNNKEYEERSERLIEKAEITGAFADNPCETVEQRFEGVKRRIFERAVDELNFKYISRIDYREMALKGVERCRALAEVVGTLVKAEDRGQMTEDKTSNIEQEDGEGEPNIAKLGETFKDFKADSNAIVSLCLDLSSLEREIRGWPAGGSKDKFLSAFSKALELNLLSARLPEGIFISEFSYASFETLDPYTVLIWPKHVEEFEKAMTNEFTGIGIEINKTKGQLTIGSLLPDTPAYHSGLDAGDIIEKVDGIPTKDMPIGCAVKHITGPAGTKVTLTIRREEESQPRDITITRAKITVPTLKGWERSQTGRWDNIIDEKDKIGYLRLTSFSESTALDLRRALHELELKGIRGLILDLRYNSGGYFESAVSVSDLFLEDGLIVITRTRYGPPSYSVARKKGTQPNYPLVVLINAGSASASEIVAGALSDPSQGRATLVGERTHGKGVVQGLTEYPGEGAQLKYTMAYYHLPSGQRVKSKEEAEKDKSNNWGITPNVTVEMRSDELRRMFDVQRDNDVLVKSGHDSNSMPVKRHTLEKTVEVDPQLETAILVVKSKLIREQAKAAAKKAA
ncbi:MAG: S41 family peptidase [Sedimentisphaerales bacterium]|nr:S41 family peptidase [Sedimentisphaerales bacterium]